MCFSNLPVEFDENGDPYLADDADDVTRPGDYTDTGEESECAFDADTTIDAAPEEAYDAILAAVPETARSHLTSPTTATVSTTLDIRDGDTDDRRGRDAAEGD